MKMEIDELLMKFFFKIFLICVVAIPVYSQKGAESTLKRFLQGLKSGQSYNDIIGTGTEIKIPVTIDKVDENKLSDGKNLAISEPVQDRALNPDEYHTGPGDIFLVYIWGKAEETLTLSVNSEGRLLIPLVGDIDLNGKTLTESKTLITDAVREVYKNGFNISVVLSNIPRFKAYIVGEVTIPGSYLISGVTRVSDLVELAGGINIMNSEDEKKVIGKMRGILLINELLEKRTVDLSAFYNSHRIDKNPYIMRGDVVYVPPRQEYVEINGFVNYEGIYDYCIGDKVKDIVIAAGGFARGADKNRIVISRFTDDYDSLVTFEIDSQEMETFTVERDDRILVCGIPDYRTHRQITIKGEVKYPGVYPIRKDKTRLADIIAMAGGLTSDAFLKGSKIVRKHYPKVGEREFERVKAMPAVSLTPLERSYLKTKLVEEDGIVSIDFEELLKMGSDIYNIILRDKDEVTIARKSLSIKVSGAVVSPGLISFKNNVGYKYYIEQAGGFNTKARKASVMIIKGGTEVTLKPQKVEKLEAGDAIWVPEKEYRDKLQIAKDILLILGSIATVTMTIFTIRDLTNNE